MALSDQQKLRLRQAIERYAFPPAYFDFEHDVPCLLANTVAVETRIRADLTSADPDRVKNGLSNVLYWGYAQIGYRENRVQRFRLDVSATQLVQAGELFRRSPPPSVLEIKKLRLPEFSGLSFVSKIRMFLDPDHSATLDRQLMKMHTLLAGTVLACFHMGANETQIRITDHNASAYEVWCRTMCKISATYFDAGFRAADIERGFFQLVQSGEAALAAEILYDALDCAAS